MSKVDVRFYIFATILAYIFFNSSFLNTIYLYHNLLCYQIRLFNPNTWKNITFIIYVYSYPERVFKASLKPDDLDLKFPACLAVCSQHNYLFLE